MATRNIYANNFKAARTLRKALTATEAIPWKRLRNRALDGHKFRRQHPIGRFVLDFYCVETLVAVEIDGGVHLAPGHRMLDVERQRELEELGVRFVRVSASEVTDNLDRVLQRVTAACASTSPPLHPSGEGAGGEG